MKTKPKGSPPKPQRAPKHARPNIVRAPTTATKPNIKRSDKITELRPYQKRAIEACLKAMQSGLTRIGVSAPTGSGKTVIFVKLIEKMIKNPDDKVLILINSDETEKQAEEQTKLDLGMRAGISVGIEKGRMTSCSLDNM
jgi:superfamily II DNA or RNA helicase